MRKFIPVEEVFAEWRTDPEYQAAYDALEEEFKEYERRCLAAAQGVAVIEPPVEIQVQEEREAA